MRIAARRTTTTASLLQLAAYWLSCATDAVAVDVRHLRFLDDDTPIPVLIGYKKDQSSSTSTAGQLASSSTSASGTTTSSSSSGDSRLSSNKALDRVNAKKSKLTRAEVQDLVDNDPDILYVEEDFLVYPLAEIIPYGIEVINANGLYPPQPFSSSSSSTGAPCSDPNSFKIGIVDTGLDINHPDIPCFNTDDESTTNCIGTTFGLGLDEEWSAPTDIHGTFVTGIIGATRGNDKGITGVLNNHNVCYIMARVFGGSAQEALLSDVLEAVEWATDQGANVLNLSLGGPSRSETEEAFYERIRNDNKLVFCASGNDGSSELFYPASYSSTVSVGAVDSSLNRADFSQYNQEVDLVAPGQAILSTAPLGIGGLYQIQVSSGSYSTLLLTGSPSPPPETSGTLVTCPDLGQAVCPGDGGHICLIERGTYRFEDKALNCQLSGGVAAIIYNNEDGYFMGILASPSQTTIPVYSLDRESGLDLMQNYEGDTVTILAQDGYTVADGTSFSSPYAAGAAAAIWQGCPDCSNEDVLSCLISTALDLGSSGRDDEYGNGLVQVEEAYLCLVETIGCCEVSPSVPTTPTQTPPSSPVTAPSPTPSPTDNDALNMSDDCTVKEEAYQQCFLNEFASMDEFDSCRTCMNNVLVVLNTATNCETLQANVCAATRGGCECSTCSDEIEDYLSCSLQTITTCPVLDCSAYDVEPSSSLIDLRFCAEQQLEMESCLTLSTAGDGSSVQQLQDEEKSECSQCLVESIPNSFAGASCFDINKNQMCPLLETCASQCSPQCSREINNFLDCVVDVNTKGCNLDCTDGTNESDNSNSVIGFTSGSDAAAGTGNGDRGRITLIGLGVVGALQMVSMIL